MKVVLQRVAQARVDVDGATVARIDGGLLLLVGIATDDTEEDVAYLAEKCVNLRIFEDEAGKMNISTLDRRAEILAISQFTLLADTRRGRRPSFTHAAPPEIAEPMFNRFVDQLRKSGLSVQTGRFGAYMKVHLLNDGPVTIILDSNDRHRSRKAG